jgi:hypothetical protein
VIDQFEELLGKDAPSEADSFLLLLRAGIEERFSPVVVLATMRSDFLGAFQQCAVLQGMEFDHLSLGPLSAESMRRLIEGPADLAGVELEVRSDGDALVERLLGDAIDPSTSTAAPSVLPLLAFTLRELWDRYHHDQILEIREYDVLGGLKGAVAKKADAVLERVLAQGNVEKVRSAFRQMARLTEEGKYVRGTPARLNEVV